MTSPAPIQGSGAGGVGSYHPRTLPTGSASAGGTISAMPLPADAPRVLVVDSNLLTAEAIALALSRMLVVARFVVPVTVGHVRDVVEWRPRLALVDIDSVEYPTSLDCVTVLQAAGVAVAVMGGRADAYLLGECVQAGAAAVVDKALPMASLQGDVARLLAGEPVMDEGERQRLLDPYHQEARARRARLAPFDVLTQREKFVLSELMEGLHADAIARRASVSTSTVRSQIKAILQKLGVSSQLAAATLATHAGWSLEAGPGPGRPDRADCPDPTGPGEAAGRTGSPPGPPAPAGRPPDRRR